MYPYRLCIGTGVCIARSVDDRERTDSIGEKGWNRRCDNFANDGSMILFVETFYKQIQINR